MKTIHWFIVTCTLSIFTVLFFIVGVNNARMAQKLSLENNKALNELIMVQNKLKVYEVDLSTLKISLDDCSMQESECEDIKTRCQNALVDKVCGELYQ